MAANPNFESPQTPLSGSALRNWLRTDGAGIFTAFSTGVESLDFARQLGVAIRTQDFYAIRREVLSVVETSDQIRPYPDNQLIPYNWHANDHGLNLTTEFQYRIHLFGADPETGLLIDKWMTVASDRQLTKDEVKEVAASYVGEGGTSGDIEEYSFAEIEALRR